MVTRNRRNPTIDLNCVVLAQCKPPNVEGPMVETTKRHPIPNVIFALKSMRYNMGGLNFPDHCVW